MGMRGKVAVLIAVPLFLGACVSNAPRDDPPPTTARTPARLSPHVEKPLDAGAFANDPCTSLTESQRQKLGLHSGTPRDEPDGVACEFRDPNDANNLLAYVFYSDRPSGLDYLYGTNKGGVLNYWKTTELDGYPAVAFSHRDHPEYCGTAVGITDSMYFSTSAGDDGCPAGEKVAAAVLSTIKANQ